METIYVGKLINHVTRELQHSELPKWMVEGSVRRNFEWVKGQDDHIIDYVASGTLEYWGSVGTQKCELTVSGKTEIGAINELQRVSEHMRVAFAEAGV